MNFIAHLRKKFYNINLTQTQKTEKKETYCNSLYETKALMKPKPGADITRKENCRAISLMKIDTKVLSKNVFLFENRSPGDVIC